VTDGAGSAVHLIERRVREYPDRAALGVTDGEKFSFASYGEVWQMAGRIAGGLLRRGISPGDRVGILLTDRATWALSYLGILRSGAIAVPLDNLQKPHEWAAVLAEARPRAMYISSAYNADLREECPEQAVPPHWLVVNTEDRPDLLSRIPAELTADHPPTWPEITGGQTAALVFTSGTTSAPKGVILTHRNLAADVEAIHRLRLFDAEDRFLSVLPIHHTFESTAGLLNPLCLGCSVAYARGLKSRELLQDLQNSQATIMLGVPLLFEKLANAIRRGINKQPPVRRRVFEVLYRLSLAGKKQFRLNLGVLLFRSLRQKANLGHLRLVVSGAAPLPPDVSEFMDILGLPILQGYGLTETSPVLSVNPPQGYKYDTVGPPLPGVEMKIINPNREGVGEIAARGEMVTPGYYNRPKETAALFADGWLLTGDLGRRNNDGHFQITGRAKNMIVTAAGKNVYPEEIEMVLAESPLILEALVYGETKPGETRERIGCAVVPDMEYLETEFGRLSRERIEEMLVAEVQSICSRLADYKRPTDISVQESEFEKTSTKKIKRFLFARTKEEQFPLDSAGEGHDGDSHA
jgi:long-chain acyl-CoA synthetase